LKSNASIVIIPLRYSGEITVCCQHSTLESATQKKDPAEGIYLIRISEVLLIY
jgi:hypothetical protein